MIKSCIIFCIPTDCFWKAILFLLLRCHLVTDTKPMEYLSKSVYTFSLVVCVTPMAISDHSLPPVPKTFPTYLEPWRHMCPRRNQPHFRSFFRI